MYNVLGCFKANQIFLCAGKISVSLGATCSFEPPLHSQYPKISVQIKQTKKASTFIFDSIMWNKTQHQKWSKIYQQSWKYLETQQ